MVDIENIIIDKIWKGFNSLRGYLDLRTAGNILRELLFLKLLNDQIKRGNKYFCERINGSINLDVSIGDIFKIYDEINIFIQSNEFLMGLSFEIFNLRDKVDHKLMLKMIEAINSIDIEIEGKPSSIFMVLINTMMKNGKGEVTTSPSINKLISSLLANKNIQELYDPTIGTGILALDVAENHENIRIYGQDINREMLDMCRMMLILDERIEDLYNIAEGNTIVNPGHIQNGSLKKFDCIVANPPFGLKDWGYEFAGNDIYNRFHRGVPSRALADYAFISHVIESLKDDGIAVMVENTGVLFKEGAEGAIREAIIKENIIDAVIALPNNMMYGTAIPVNLIIFNKDKKTDDILFIDVSREVQFNKVLTCFTDKNIEDIVEVYKNRTLIEGLSSRVSVNEIVKNSYNLNVQRYIEVKVEKEDLDMKQIGNDINELVMKLKETQDKINEILAE